MISRNPSRCKGLISIIIPVYKAEKYLDRCLESVLRQTYPQLEILLVDDGSPDHCPEMCDQWAQKDKRIKVLHKKNGGLSDARNAGLTEAIGEYICFLDSDDYIASDYCEYLYQHRVPYGITICGFYMVYDKKIVTHELVNLQCDSEEAIRLYLAAADDKADFCAYAWNKLYHHTLFDSISYPKGKVYEDTAIICQLLYQATEICITRQAKYYYIMRSDSIVHQSGEKGLHNALSFLDVTRIQRAFLEKYYPRNKEFQDLADRAILYAYYNILKHLPECPSELKDRYNQFLPECKELWRTLRERNVPIPRRIRVQLFLVAYCPTIFQVLCRLKEKI